MRDCLFLVADKNMESMLKGFFSRENFHLALGCAPFNFDFKQDLVVAHGQNDPGLYTRANALLQPYARTHRHVVVMVDVDWDGSPGHETIKQAIQSHIINAGWVDDSGGAIVIEPELENWVWQDSIHVCNSLGYNDGFQQLRSTLEAKGYWKAHDPKPHRPKEAMEWTLKQAKIPRTSSIFSQLASQVSFRGCIDPAFQNLLMALRRWFPAQKIGSMQ